MNKILIGLFIFSVQLLVLQQFRVNSLHEQLSLTEKAKEIQDDQVNELTYQIYRLQTETQQAETRQFISGVVSTIKNDPRENYSGIWHDGYNRGLEQQKEVVYTNK